MPCRFPPRHRACRSLPPEGSRLSCRSSELRPHERVHQGQQRLTCEDAGSWTHACLSATTRFCSSTAHFRVQAPGQLRNPGPYVAEMLMGWAMFELQKTPEEVREALAEVSGSRTRPRSLISGFRPRVRTR